MTEDEDWEPFACGAFRCDACGAELPVPVLARTVYESGDAFLETRADMSDVWAHTWMHETTPIE